MDGKKSHGSACLAMNYATTQQIIPQSMPRLFGTPAVYVCKSQLTVARLDTDHTPRSPNEQASSSSELKHPA